MRLPSLLACFVLIAVLFAGCSSGGGSDDETSTTSTSASKTSSSGSKTSTTSTTTSSQTTTTTSGNPTNSTNHAPSAILTAAISNGTAPLRVNFTMAGNDSDGDALAWALTFGDGNKTNGTSLPAVAEYTYMATGAFNVTLVVTDGSANTTSSLIVNVTAGGAAKETFVISATYVGIDPLAGGTPATNPSCSLGDEGIGGNWHVYNRDLAGWSFVIAPAKFAAIFYKSDGTTRAGTFGSTGVVPAAAIEVDICTADPQAGGSYKFTATAP